MRKFVLALEESEFEFVLSKLLQIFEQIDIGLILVDQNQNIKFVNPAFAHFYGWSRDKIEGSSVFEFLEFHGDSHKFGIKKKDGETILIPGVAFLLKNSSGDLVFQILVVNTTETYITKVRELENILLFIRGAIHDFNNLLNVIGMNLEILEFFSNEAKNQPIFEKIQKAILKILEILRRVSVLYRGTTEEYFSIKDLLTETVDIVLSGSDINYELIIDDNIPDIKGDKVQISQVIQNLVINAKEAMEDDNRIVIRASLVTEEGGESIFKDWVKIEVEDWGCGIDEKYISKIFDPEFSTKRKEGGLGLAVSKRIIERHGGVLKVMPKEKGTIFIVYLPIKEDILI